MTKPDTKQVSAGKGPGGMDQATFDALTDDEVAAAVARDSDAVPTTSQSLARMRRISPARLIRQKLGMSQRKFSDAFGIPEETLLAWERHEMEPSVVEFAYLRAIERNPDAVRKASA